MTGSLIEKCSWLDVREQVLAVNPSLTKVIDDIDPDKECFIWKIKYPFGENIIQNNKLNIQQNSSSPLTKELNKTLGYTNNLPLGLSLNKGIQIYSDRLTEHSPTCVLYPGDIFGYRHLFAQGHSSIGNEKITSATAGAKPLFFLASIADIPSLKRLKKRLSLQQNPTRKLTEQWPILQEIARSPILNKDWKAEVLLFPLCWLEKINSQSARWATLRLHLLEQYCQKSFQAEDKAIFSSVFYQAIATKNLKATISHVNITRQLFFQAMGLSPGYQVATDDILAPTSALKKVFSEIYQLKFTPSLVHMAQNNPLKSNNPTYYSLEFPMTSTHSFLPTKDGKKINDLRIIKHIQESASSMLKSNALLIENDYLQQVLHEVQFDYFHNTKDSLHNIQFSKEVERQDPGLLQDRKTFGGPFCYTSSFLKGCIRISRLLRTKGSLDKQAAYNQKKQEKTRVT